MIHTMNFRTKNVFENSISMIVCISSCIHIMKKYLAYCFLRNALKGVFIKQLSQNNFIYNGTL